MKKLPMKQKAFEAYFKIMFLVIVVVAVVLVIKCNG